MAAVTKQIIVSTRITPKVARALRRTAKAQGTTRSKLVARLIESEVALHEYCCLAGEPCDG